MRCSTLLLQLCRQISSASFQAAEQSAVVSRNSLSSRSIIGSGCATARQLSTESQQSATDRLTIAIILERLPVVTPTPPQWALDHHQWLTEASNRKRAEKPDYWIDIDKDKADIPGQTGWKPADRISDADRANDTKSLWRCMEQRLYFVVKAKGGSWQFPEDLHRSGETMRAAAERILSQAITPQNALQTHFLGNGPIGHLNRTDSPLFFHRAQLIKGSLVPSSGSSAADFAWLNKDEIINKTTEPTLQSLLQKML